MLRLNRPLGLIAALAIATFASVALAAASGDAAKGKETYLAVGCFTCHGRAGQGGRLNYPAPALAQLQMPVEALQAYLRNPPGDMPPYVASVLSDQDVADIHAFLQSLPGRVDPKTIPLL
jgi:mono/diheme cytochrome c family protein